MSSPVEEKMESEQSYSGESSSSSDSSSGSSEGEEEAMEAVRILGHTLELPQELCEDYAVFREFFSKKTWDSLEEEHQEELKSYLPTFPVKDKEEKEKTIKMLFNYDTFHFTTPLNDFYNNLKQGNYRPDIAKMRKFLKRARTKQQRHRTKSYYAKLLPELLLSRERLLASMDAAPPGPAPSLPILPLKFSTKNHFKPLHLRAKQRYFEELAAIRSEVGGEESEDDNYPDGPPQQYSRKKKNMPGQSQDSNISGTLGSVEASQSTSLDCLKNALSAHRARRQYRENHPELNTTGITLEDIKQRVALVNGAKKLMFGGTKSELSAPKLKRGPKKDAQQNKGKSIEGKPAKRKEDVESVENKPLLLNIKIKCEQEESDSESSSFVDPVASPKQSRKLFDQVEIKQEVDMKYPNVNLNYNDPKLESIIKQEPQDLITMQGSSKMLQPVPIKLEDLDGIDMMALPVELADDSGDVVQVDTSTEMSEEPVLDPDDSLTETTYANFLALVRALFPARAAHRASKQQLHARCAAVMRSPIAPLNTWYSMSEDWCSELDSALDFLAGERGPHPDDFVPYLQFMPDTQMYQWIGAGRDCDSILGRIWERWLRSSSPTPSSSDAPPPKYPTSWAVRAPSVAELAEFRAQERSRFATATKPFTYALFGYRSVVGPCSRGFSSECGGVLSPQRPRHATFPALLRDAVARLPNGEGTRHDILTLLKMSQWVTPSSDQALLVAVSSTLDKMHSAKRDPIVKYEQRTAIWTYLHRHKSEEDWVKNSGSRRVKAAPAGQPAAAPAAACAPPAAPAAAPATTPATTPAAPALQHLTPPHAMDMEVASVEEVIDNGSDTDVDVDDTGSQAAGSHLSSAQLLMQATQTQPSQATLLQQTQKPKGKLVPVSPQKAKTILNKHIQNQAKANLVAQSVKQANLLNQVSKQTPLPAQAAKQANLIAAAKQNLLAQTTKQANLVVQSPKQTPAPQLPKQPVQTFVSQAAKQSIIIPATSKPANVIPHANKPNIQVQMSKQITPQALKATLMAQSAKQANAIAQLTKNPVPKPTVQKQVNIVKQTNQSPKHQVKPSVPHLKHNPPSKPVLTSQVPRQEMPKVIHTPPAKPLPVVVPAPNKSPLLKQRPLQKQIEITQTQSTTPTIICQQPVRSPTLIQPIISTAVPIQTQNKPMVQTTRSLLIRPPNAQTTVATIVSTSTQIATTLPSTQRRGVVRVLSPATSSSGKSLISPRALLQQGLPMAKKRVESPSVTTIAQSPSNVTTVVSSVPTAMTSSVSTRTVQLAGGRTVQLAANQTVHLPGGQSVQLSSGHTLQLSSLQLPTHSVRLPSGQTVQLASPQAVQAIRAVSSTAAKPSSPRALQSSPTVKPQTSSVQIPISSVQLAGQTVQIGGQTVQLAGQSVQLTGHTVKLPSGQSVQVASQSVLSPQSVQLSSGQTVQIANANVQMPTGQSVQLGGQTVQIGGQTVQLQSGQTVQLSSGQTLQLASGQTVQIPNQQAQKTVTQVVRNVNQAGAEKGQPIVAKLLTNAQGQMISLEGGVGGARALQVSGVRVLSPATRMTRPLLLTTAKPLHNIILQSDGSAIRVTSTGAASTSQTIVLSNIGAQTITTSTTSAPVLKLQQAGASTSVPTSTVRSVLMDGQQLKLVGGRHVLARILRPANPHQNLQ